MLVPAAARGVRGGRWTSFQRQAKESDLVRELRKKR
jgi:hypothetical protein